MSPADSRYASLVDGSVARARDVGRREPPDRGVTEGLSTRDSMKVLDLVDRLSRSGSLRELRFALVDQVPLLIPAERFGWAEADVGSGYVKAVLHPEHGDWSRLEQAFAATLGEHPVLAHYATTGDCGPLAISDFLSPTDLHSTPLYRNFLGPLDTEDQLCLVIPDLSGTSFLAGLAVFRCRPGFSHRDRALLTALAPHVRNAYRHADDLERVQRILVAVAARAPEPEGEGVVLLDRFARADYASPNALDILSRWFPGWSGQDLPTLVSNWLRVGWSSHRQPVTLAWPLVIDRHHGTLTIRKQASPDGLGAQLLVSERARPTKVPATYGLLGLTAREGEVIALACRGMPNASIGQELGISPRTAEKHVQHSLEKLGARNRTQAAEIIRQIEEASDPLGP
jgi:DNA-binding CsgD family transcriptional regulator